jgi:hypothetical protein
MARAPLPVTDVDADVHVDIKWRRMAPRTWDSIEQLLVAFGIATPEEGPDYLAITRGVFGH